MARLVLTNPGITINAVNLADHIASVTIDTSVNEVEVTAFGDSGAKRVGGLQDNSITLSFHQDYATSSVEQTIYPLIGTTTSIIIKPVSGTTTTTNPSYTAEVLVTGWNSVNGSVGDLTTADVTWPVNGLITKSNS
jgi:hypothetical protein